MTATGVRTARLDAAGGLEPEAILGSLAAHNVPGAERTDPSEHTHTRLVHAPRGLRAVTLRVRPGGLELEAAAEDEAEFAAIERLVRTWFDLDTELEPVRDALEPDAVLGPLLARRPGLRVIRTPHRFQTAVTTVLGQQVSLAAGRTFAGRLVASYGEPGPDGLRSFPEASVLASTDTEELRAAVGLTSARARTVQALATAWLDAAGAPSRRELLSLPGIGPWTADYLAVRYGDRDAFTPSDLVLRRALGGISAREAEARSEAWRPYRAYALMHLWTETAYAGRP